MREELYLCYNQQSTSINHCAEPVKLTEHPEQEHESPQLQLVPQLQLAFEPHPQSEPGMLKVFGIEVWMDGLGVCMFEGLNGDSMCM